MKTTYALVTGASSGIGKSIAYELAARKRNLLIISLPGEGLKDVSEDIKEKYSVKVDYMEIDLSEKNGPRHVYEWTEERGYVVDMLVNNAGKAGTAMFESSDDFYIDDRLQVNIRALVFLCRYYIPGMRELPQAWIINIGSLSAFFSIPFKSLYSSTKAFVVNFSRALKTELKDTGISVSVVCPNGVRTNEGTHARIESHGKKGRLTSVSVEEVARITVERSLKKRFLIIPGRINYTLIIVKKLLPSAVEQRLLYREFYKEVRVS